MPNTPIPRLTALTLTSLERGGSTSALVQGHQAAYMRGVADRTGVEPKGLSKVERGELKKIVAKQLEHWNAYQAEGKDSAGRTALYAKAVGASYYAGRTGGTVASYPRDGSTPCHGNCGCAWEEHSDGWHWILGGSGNSCAECKQRASTWRPYRGG